MKPETQEKMEIVKKWAYERINPMFGVYQACKQIYANGYPLDSNDPVYRRTYRLLETMVKEGILLAHGTPNGGNVYMLRARDVKNGDIPF